jgi:transcription factor CP2-like protein
MTAAVHWQVDDIDDALAADFDGSLSGLGMELGTSSFNMRCLNIF